MPARSAMRKTVGPDGRVAREPGQGLTAAAISGVVRAGGVLAVFPIAVRISLWVRRPAADAYAA